MNGGDPLLAVLLQKNCFRDSWRRFLVFLAKTENNSEKDGGRNGETAV